MEYIPDYPQNCPYPNLYYEYRFQVLGSYDTYAEHAKVTPKIFEDMLNGIGDLTADEKYYFYRTYAPRDYSSISYNYLFSSRISFYDMQNKKHLHKFQRLYKRLNNAVAAASPTSYYWKRFNWYKKIDELINVRFIPRAYYNYVLSLIRPLETYYRINTQKPRSTTYFVSSSPECAERSS